MARSRRRKQRDTTTISSRRLLHTRSVPSLRLSPIDLRLFEDRRLYAPSKLARGLFSGDAETVVAAPRRRSDTSTPFRLAFRSPNRVFTCVRRKQRREVMFAFNKTGKGARSRRIRNENSDMRC